VTREFKPTHVVNERDKPRVLIWVDSQADYEWVESRAGSFKYIYRLNEVDFDEWDVLVTNFQTNQYQTAPDGIGRYRQRIVPPNLYVFRVLDPGVGVMPDALLDFGQNHGERVPNTEIEWSRQIPGNQVRRVDNLPEALQDLVQVALVQAVQEREFQHGIRIPDSSDRLDAAYSNFRPFLVGPQGLILACSYTRHDGASVWIVPEDVMDLGAWFDLALSEWHAVKPEVFPGTGVWQTSSEWMTIAERKVFDDISVIDRQFSEAATKYENSRAELERVLEEQRLVGNTGRRRLLTAQSEDLQVAVRDALIDLGFDVEDMDPKWAERERREDFRIKDPDDLEWLVIGDSTGVAKGAKASKFTTLAVYVTKFMLEERPETAPGQWLLVNRFFDRDPNSRGDVLRDDDLMVVAEAGGLAFDTSALFVLVEACSSNPDLSKSVRAWLRGLTGQLSLEMAREWVRNANQS